MDASHSIDVSASGWDSEMVTYPAVIDDGARLHMFYNGNDYGRSGIGYATSPTSASRCASTRRVRQASKLAVGSRTRSSASSPFPSRGNLKT